MKIGDKIYKDLKNTDLKLFEKQQLEMALICDKNNWCMEDGVDDDGREFLIINPYVPPSLDYHKRQKLYELKAIRDKAEVENIVYNGNNYDYDDKARERINAAIIALDVQTAQAKVTASIDWTTADNQDVKVTADDLRMIVVMVAQRSNSLHVAYRAAKDRVEAATTVEEVETITLGV